MAAMLMGAWSLQSCDNGPTKEVWLDEFGQDSCYVPIGIRGICRTSLRLGFVQLWYR